MELIGVTARPWRSVRAQCLVGGRDLFAASPADQCLRPPGGGSPDAQPSVSATDEHTSGMEAWRGVTAHSAWNSSRTRSAYWRPMRAGTPRRQTVKSLSVSLGPRSVQLRFEVVPASGVCRRSLRRCSLRFARLRTFCG